MHMHVQTALASVLCMGQDVANTARFSDVRMSAGTPVHPRRLRPREPPWGLNDHAISAAGAAQRRGLAVAAVGRSDGVLVLSGLAAGPGEAGNIWTATPRVATRKPPPASRSIAPARLFAQRTMERWGEAARADDVAAVVSELLANAVRHGLSDARDTGATVGPWPIRLGLLHAGPYVIAAVADPSGTAPELRDPDWLAESGRGLMVVSSLSDHWGYCFAPAGLARSCGRPSPPPLARSTAGASAISPAATAARSGRASP